MGESEEALKDKQSLEEGIEELKLEIGELKLYVDIILKMVSGEYIGSSMEYNAS